MKRAATALTLTIAAMAFTVAAQNPPPPPRPAAPREIAPTLRPIGAATRRGPFKTLVLRGAI